MQQSIRGGWHQELETEEDSGICMEDIGNRRVKAGGKRGRQQG